MFKNLIKGVKNILKSPVGQIGTALLLPGLAGVQGAGTMASLARGIGSFAAAQPMLTQAGLGLLAGDKPENVLRNVAYGSLARGIGAMGTPEGFMGGVKSGFGIQGTPAVDYTSITGMEGSPELRAPTPAELPKPGMLEKAKSLFIKQGEGLDFFEKYSPLLKMGTIGASILAATLSDDEMELLYDPNKNPYLKTGTRSEDFYRDINPLYTEAYGKKAGGIMDFPKKQGMIDGPGNGQSDDIPAMLSDGEFVMTKQAVMAAGNGDREKGTKKMYEMMYSLENKADNMGIGRK